MFVSLVSRCYRSDLPFHKPLPSAFRLLCSPCVETLFEFLAVLQIAAGLFLLWRGIQWLPTSRTPAHRPGFYAPRTPVLCPCRGWNRLERNLVSLCEFRHQNFEVFFILASENDPLTASSNASLPPPT